MGWLSAWITSENHHTCVLVASVETLTVIGVVVALVYLLLRRRFGYPPFQLWVARERCKPATGWLSLVWVRRYAARTLRRLWPRLAVSPKGTSNTLRAPSFSLTNLTSWLGFRVRPELSATPPPPAPGVPGWPCHHHRYALHLYPGSLSLWFFLMPLGIGLALHLHGGHWLGALGAPVWFWLWFRLMYRTLRRPVLDRLWPDWPEPLAPWFLNVPHRMDLNPVDRDWLADDKSPTAHQLRALFLQRSNRLGRWYVRQLYRIINRAQGLHAWYSSLVPPIQFFPPRTQEARTDRLLVVRRFRGPPWLTRIIAHHADATKRRWNKWQKPKVPLWRLRTYRWRAPVARQSTQPAPPSQVQRQYLEAAVRESFEYRDGDGPGIRNWLAYWYTPVWVGYLYLMVILLPAGLYVWPEDNPACQKPDTPIVSQLCPQPKGPIDARVPGADSDNLGAPDTCATKLKGSISIAHSYAFAAAVWEVLSLVFFFQLLATDDPGEGQSNPHRTLRLRLPEESFHNRLWHLIGGPRFYASMLALHAGAYMVYLITMQIVLSGGHVP